MNPRLNSNPTSRLSRARIAAGRIAAVLLVVSLITAALVGVHDDSQIRLHVSGAFEYMEPDQVNQRVTPLIKDGFFRMNVESVRREVESLGWVHHARIRRTWPYGLRIRVWEQQPVARWNAVAWLNPEGDVFHAESTHPSLDALPELYGPEERAKDVLAAWGDTRELLAPGDYQASMLTMDERGAWELKLSNGVSLRLGRNDVVAAVDRFMRSVAHAIGGRFGEIEYVDLRHTNGFAVGWRPAVAMSPQEGRGS